MADTCAEIVTLLKQPDLLASMHVVAERSNVLYGTHHVLIKNLARVAFGPDGEAYASLGAGVHEVLTGYMPLETPHPRIVAREGTLPLLSHSNSDVADLVLDAAAGFRSTEPQLSEAVREVVGSHLQARSSRELAFFGAALSYSMELQWWLENNS